MTAHPRRPAFDWHDVKAQKNIRKHGVSFDEAATVFEDPFSISDSDPLHSDDETRYVIIGFSKENRLLVVAYAMKRERIRIINSRPATARERRNYEEE
ncbi:MAG TPA: BrnT family toxin [Thermoanaerobaculia bacterium]|nr:BrnT family toxin [Thermoanaerobaculia bacterium]